MPKIHCGLRSPRAALAMLRAQAELRDSNVEELDLMQGGRGVLRARLHCLAGLHLFTHFESCEIRNSAKGWGGIRGGRNSGRGGEFQEGGAEFGLSRSSRYLRTKCKGQEAC